MKETAVALAWCLLAASTLGCAAKSAGSPPSAVAASSRSLDLTRLEGSDANRLNDAVQLMDAGKLDSAISILENVRTRRPNQLRVLHELALSYRLQRHPEKAIELLAPFRRDLPDDTLAALGSALDEAGKRGDAEALFREALAKHSNSGIFCSELATTLRSSGKNDEAFALYERGMRVDPSFPANYLHAAEMLETSDRRGLSVIYDEMFRVLEPGSDRSKIAAKAMVGIYRDAVKLEKRGAQIRGHVSMAPELVVERPEQVSHMPLVNRFELLFGPGLVMAHKDGLTLATLHAARAVFLKQTDKAQPTEWDREPLFAWLRRLDKAGQLEAYDYWLYGPAFPDEFGRWLKSHSADLEGTVQYLATHPLFPAGR